MPYDVRMTDPSSCDRLGGCIHICPEKVWKWAEINGRNLPVPVRPEDCTGCMKCIKICPPKIIEVTVE
ncbi:MAG: 4Fe-4S binding protein [Candidatus Thermoplasmatota archaeon]|nr:hypothetical protein [Euryarchaeota archaeon]MBU4031170.1 4Fe-4S binding protein [Candidatus Thermoplasmatota archaeon]MBU4071841.1 4Fe-4S binding protein [Candidatus Thermoplasmatota archaeon]MBU4144665.1 4Fe-4S binding protein [Candidatus Thermoplasmatota archaeon]MBU4592518.1 4Fe-4S binding protein [Candidatus Thermoplasmatota archaeon]